MTKKNDKPVEKLVELAKALREASEVTSVSSPPQFVMDSVHNLVEAINEEIRDYRNRDRSQDIDYRVSDTILHDIKKKK